MGVFSTLCKWFGHSWEQSTSMWNLRYCKRCDASELTFYTKERGLYREEVN